MSNREIEELESENDDIWETVDAELEIDFHSSVQTSSHEEGIAEVSNTESDAHHQEHHSGIGDDHLEGGDGDDDIFGDAGDDVLIAGLGDDHLDGDEGNDQLHAGIGNDHLDGGYGDDAIFGDDGDDVLRAGYGSDVLTGGAGLDDFTFYAAGDFRVTDYNIFDDNLVFDSTTTGLHDLEDLLRVITNISDTTEGVVIEFGSVATITLVGLTTANN